MATIDKTYHQLLDHILKGRYNYYNKNRSWSKKGFTYEDPNRKGINRIQIPSYTFKHDFKDGFPAITTKKLFWKGVVGELIWFLRGDTNIKYLVDNGIHIWDRDAYNYYLRQTNQQDTDEVREEFNKGIYEINHRAGNLGRVYGYQLRRFGDNFDQLEWIIYTLRNNPLATKKTVTFINPNDKKYQALTPCHTGFKILVEPMTITQRFDILSLGWHGLYKNYLKNYILSDYPEKDYNLLQLDFLNTNNVPEYQFTLQWEQDSVDTFLGLPFNIASYALLAHIIGKMTNMIPKGIIGDLSNVHIYEPHLDAVKEQLSRDVDVHNNCELDMKDRFVYRDGTSVNNCIDLMKISDFRLKDYQSYPYIKADMLAYNK